MAGDAPKPPKKSQFQAGENWKGNRAGRPKGSSRKELAREFLEDMRAIWSERGSEVLQRVINEDPATFLRAMVAIMPKELDVNINRYDEMTIDQLQNELNTAIRDARALGVNIDAGDAASLH